MNIILSIVILTAGLLSSPPPVNIIETPPSRIQIDQIHNSNSVIKVLMTLNKPLKVSESVENMKSQLPTPKPVKTTIKVSKMKINTVSTLAMKKNTSYSQTKEYVKSRALKEFGWSNTEWDALEFIVTKESSWNYLAVNKSSGACGLFQALPCSKMGNPWNSIEVQTNFGLNYIKARYKTPTGAKNFWLKNKWY